MASNQEFHCHTAIKRATVAYTGLQSGDKAVKVHVHNLKLLSIIAGNKIAYDNVKANNFIAVNPFKRRKRGVSSHFDYIILFCARRTSQRERGGQKQKYFFHF